jgi:predicted nucleic acid-binding protein
MATVYIETTIPSFYHETRTSAEAVAWRHATRRWWDRYRHEYTLVTSEVVLEELRLAPPHKAQGVRMLDGLTILDRTRRVAEAAALYLEHRLVPNTAVPDAVHLALASVHGIDFLLTWNCRHLANVRKRPHIAALNLRLGLPVPVVTTPLTLQPENDDGP